METLAIPFDQVGLPLTDMIDFIMDIGANWSNLKDSDKEIRQMGLFGFVALVISCGVNCTMLIMHYNRFKKLYDTLMGKSRTLKYAFFIWMPIACSNIEVVLLFILFAKMSSGSFEINLGFKTFQYREILDHTETFLPKALRNEMEVASMQVKKFALFSQLTENLPELIFQGRACLLMMAADPPRIPGNWQLLSLASTFAMLFGKMIVNMLLFAADVGVSKQLMKLFLEKGIPTSKQDDNGHQIMNTNDKWRLPPIKEDDVPKRTYWLCFASGFVNLCSAAFFAEMLLYAEFAKEDLLEVIILMLFAAGLLTLITFFITTRLIVQELDLCWQINLDVYKATFVLLCSSFASGILAAIHKDLAIAANRHLAGFLSILRSCLFIALLATTDIYPKEMRNVMGKPSLAWNIHGWFAQIVDDASIGSLALHRCLLIIANLVIAVIHLTVFVCGCRFQQRIVTGDYLKMSDMEAGDQKIYEFTTAQELSEAHDHLEQVQAERIETLLGKEVSKKEEFDDLVESTLIILDPDNATYQKLLEFKRKREDLEEALKRAEESIGSSELRTLLHSIPSKFGLDMSGSEKELEAREAAEESLQKSIGSSVGAKELKEMIDTLTDAKIDLEVAKKEVQARSDAEKKLTEGIRGTIGSESLKSLLESLGGIHISFEDANTEMTNREKAEKELAESVKDSVGTVALEGLLQSCSGKRIDVSAYDKELDNRRKAEKELEAAINLSVGHEPVQNALEQLSNARIQLDPLKEEVAKRSEAEKMLREAEKDLVGAKRLEEVIESLRGIRINLESAELNNRVKAEKELEEIMSKTGQYDGPKVINDAIERLSSVRIDLTAAKAEAKKHQEYDDDRLKKVFRETLGSAKIQEYLDNAPQIADKNVELATTELKTRQRDEDYLRQAMKEDYDFLKKAQLALAKAKIDKVALGLQPALRRLHDACAKDEGKLFRWKILTEEGGFVYQSPTKKLNVFNKPAAKRLSDIPIGTTVTGYRIEDLDCGWVKLEGETGFLDIVVCEWSDDREVLHMTKQVERLEEVEGQALKPKAYQYVSQKIMESANEYGGHFLTEYEVREASDADEQCKGYFQQNDNNGWWFKLKHEWGYTKKIGESMRDARVLKSQEKLQSQAQATTITTLAPTPATAPSQAYDRYVEREYIDAEAHLQMYRTEAEVRAACDADGQCIGYMQDVIRPERGVTWQMLKAGQGRYRNGGNYKNLKAKRMGEADGYVDQEYIADANTHLRMYKTEAEVRAACDADGQCIGYLQDGRYFGNWQMLKAGTNRYPGGANYPVLKTKRSSGSAAQH